MGKKLLRGTSEKFGRNPFTSGDSECENIGFQFGNEDFFVLTRKVRDCAETYYCTSHKHDR
jgi:hypothetical protein